jgi:hypothetical protein
MMFEELEARVARAAQVRAGERTQRLAEELRFLLPPDIRVETIEEGVLLSGPGFGRRFVQEASLRWTIAGLLK